MNNSQYCKYTHLVFLSIFPLRWLDSAVVDWEKILRMFSEIDVSSENKSIWINQYSCYIHVSLLLCQVFDRILAVVSYKLGQYLMDFVWGKLLDQILARDKAALCCLKQPLRCFYQLDSDSAVTGKSPYGGELVLLNLHSCHHSSVFGAILRDGSTAEALLYSSNSLMWNCILSLSPGRAQSSCELLYGPLWKSTNMHSKISFDSKVNLAEVRWQSSW